MKNHMTFFFVTFSTRLWLMMMMKNCFCGMVDRRKAFSLISSRDHCQRSSPSRIVDTLRAGFEFAQNLSSGFVEWSCAVVITTTPQRQTFMYAKPLRIMFGRVDEFIRDYDRTKYSVLFCPKNIPFSVGLHI